MFISYVEKKIELRKLLKYIPRNCDVIDCKNDFSE